MSHSAMPSGLTAFRDAIDANFQRIHDANHASKTATFTAFSDDATGSPKDTYLCDATGGAITANLPAVADTRLGRRVCVIKTDASGNAVTVDGNAAETINGAATYSLAAQWKSVTLENTGTAWIVVAST